MGEARRAILGAGWTAGKAFLLREAKDERRKCLSRVRNVVETNCGAVRGWSEWGRRIGRARRARCWFFNAKERRAYLWSSDPSAGSCTVRDVLQWR